MNAQFATLMSAFVAMGIVALLSLGWVDSYTHRRCVMWNGMTDYEALSGKGIIVLVRREWWVPLHRGVWRRRPYNALGVFSGEVQIYGALEGAGDSMNGIANRFGFGWNFNRSVLGHGSEHRQRVCIPYWFLTALTGLLCVQCFHRRARMGGRSAAGRCRSCGYDLRASPTRCPECGAVSTKVVNGYGASSAVRGVSIPLMRRLRDPLSR